MALEAIRVQGTLEGDRRRRRQPSKDKEKKKRFDAALSEKLGEDASPEEPAKPKKEPSSEPETAPGERAAVKRLDIVV